MILVDSAYCLNEYLVGRGYALSSRPGTEDGWNSYLVACLLLSLTVFAAVSLRGGARGGGLVEEAVEGSFQSVRDWTRNQKRD